MHAEAGSGAAAWEKKMIRFKLGTLIRFDDGGPAVQSVAESGHTRVTLITLKAGQGLKDHRTACQVCLQLLQGTAVVIEEGKSLEAGEGDLILIPPGAKHRVEAVADCAILAILTPHPARAQYPPDQVDRIVPRLPHDQG
jgi:quercetin dioxygenase-like cupin family protein